MIVALLYCCILYWQSSYVSQTTVIYITCQLRGLPIFSTVCDWTLKCRRRAGDVVWTDDSSHSWLRMRWNWADFYIQSYFIFADLQWSRNNRRWAGQQCAAINLRSHIDTSLQCLVVAKYTIPNNCISQAEFWKLSVEDVVIDKFKANYISISVMSLFNGFLLCFNFDVCIIHCESKKLGPFSFAHNILSDLNNSFTVSDRN